MAHPDKLEWEGIVLGVQPRIRLQRSFDERTHEYLGFNVILRGALGIKDRDEFTVAIGKGAQAKHDFRPGDILSGKALPVEDPRRESAELYKASALKVLDHRIVDENDVPEPPPLLAFAPTLEDYRARGHRRLSARTYAAKCRTCMWACDIPVVMTIDHWNPSKVRHRRETFCYGPKSCANYCAGPTRKVPGRDGMTWEEEDWVDADATAHRAPDE